MRIDVLTLFPEMLDAALSASILGRAREAGLLDVRLVDIRDHSGNRHRKVDDAPYGGGAGMVLAPGPVFAASEAAAAEGPAPDRIILLTPGGRAFTQDVARELAACRRLLLLCGRYEGVDARVHEHLATEELSIGDFVLTGGEPAALVVIDAVARLLPGVLGKDESSECESFSEPLLEHPHYTRPADFRGWEVPPVLLSGDHGAIARWRRAESLRRTLLRRPDLLAQATLSESDLRLLGLLSPPARRRRKSPGSGPLSGGPA